MESNSVVDALGYQPERYQRVEDRQCGRRNRPYRHWDCVAFLKQLIAFQATPKFRLHWLVNNSDIRIPNC
jgi:hypothetical protein